MHEQSVSSAFRAEVDAFVAEHWPTSLQGAALTRADWRAGRPLRDAPAASAWLTALGRRGWLVPQWPKAHGGTGWSVAELAYFEAATARAGTPLPDAAGTEVVGPLLCAAGNAGQQTQHLPAIRQAACRWCLALEPDTSHPAPQVRPRAGGLRISADWPLVPGAADAHWMLGLVPVGGGADLLLIDLAAPGVSRTRRRSLDGGSAGARVVLADLPLAATARLGAPGGGRVLLADLAALPGAATLRAARLAVQARHLRAAAARLPDGHGGRVADSPDIARALAALEVDIAALDGLELRAAWDAGRGVAQPALALAATCQRAALTERLATLAVDVAGPQAVAFPDPDSSIMKGRSGMITPWPRSPTGCAVPP